MATRTSNGAAPVVDLKPRSPNGSGRRATARAHSPVAEVHETPTDVIVRVRLQQGALELSVPKRALSDTHRVKHTVTTPGSNPDAAAC